MSDIKVPAKNNLAKARGKSRRLAMQAIYQWQMTGDSIAGIKQQFLEENDSTKIDVEYFIAELFLSKNDVLIVKKTLKKRFNSAYKRINWN